MKMTADISSNGLRALPEYEDLLLHDTGGIRPLGRTVSKLVVSALITLTVPSAVGIESTAEHIDEPFVVATDSSRLKKPATAGQQYANSRLDAMRGKLEYPGFRDEFPTYPTVATIENARGFVDVLVTETTPTPSVVPGDGGVVEFIWQKSGWDLMFAVGDPDADVWARYRLTGEILVYGNRLEDYLQFAEILKSLSIG